MCASARENQSNLSSDFKCWPYTDLQTSKLDQAFPRQGNLWFRQFVKQGRDLVWFGVSEWKDASVVQANPELSHSGPKRRTGIHHHYRKRKRKKKLLGLHKTGFAILLVKTNLLSPHCISAYVKIYNIIANVFAWLEPLHLSKTVVCIVWLYSVSCEEGQE